MKKLPQILCIDGENKTLASLIPIFSDQGYEAIFTKSAKEAVNQAKQNFPDLMLICVEDDLNLLKEIKSAAHIRYLPVLAVIPQDKEEIKKQVIDSGCEDFITSPVDTKELITRLKLFVKLGRYRKQLSAQEKFEVILRQMSDGIVICDLDWTLQRINLAAGRKLNLSAEVDTNVLNYIYKNFSVSIPKETLLSLNEFTTRFDIVREETKNTKVLFLEATRDLLTNLGGETTGILLTLRDVTEKRKEEMLKHNFLSFISHKLKTPLTVLFARCDLIRSGVFGSLNEKQLSELNSLMSEIRHLRTLFNKLLNFVEHQKDAVESIKLSEYLDAFFRRLINIYPYRKIEVKRDITPEDMAIFISKGKINDIFENLAENAVKFNSNERVLITIFAQEASNGFANMSFSDNGDGIPSEEYDKIFDKFYQVEKNFTGELKGVGIGLSHVKKIIEDAGGTIKVDSKINKGTTFMFKLPVAKKSG
jgi:signal transduction histidine kinase